MSSRIIELHSKYKKYQFKRYLKIVSIFLLISILPIGGYYLKEYFDLSQSIVEAVDIKENIQVVQKDLPEVKEKSVSPSYVLSVSNKELEESIKNASAKKSINTEEKKIVKTDNVVTTKAVKIEKIAPKFIQISPIEEIDIEADKDRENYFEDNTKEHSIEDWISKYENKKSYALAIYISNYYYKKQDFKNSAMWARRANKHDRNKENAWLLYAKSVYALGDIKKAKSILNIFIQYKESAKAEILLSEWEE